MLHQRLLPAAFHLITRCTYGIHHGPGNAAATANGQSAAVREGMMFAPRRHGLVGRSFRPSPKSIARCSGSASGKSSVQLCHHKICGPVIHRSQSPTHLDRVEDAVDSCLLHYQRQILSSPNNCNSQIDTPQIEEPEELKLDTFENILNFSPRDREAIGVASHLKRRLRGLSNNGDCRRCWLQKRHCVCETCVPLEGIDGSFNDRRGLPNVDRLFLLTHHKEICLAVDTAKLILAAFPTTARLVVGGVGPEFQPAMGEMLDAVSDAVAAKNNDCGTNDEGGKCLILFPTEDAKTFDEIKEDMMAAKLRDSGKPNMDANQTTTFTNHAGSDVDKGWDVVVIDGTWSQARKMHSKYFPRQSEGHLHRVQLSQEAVMALDRNSSDGGVCDDASDENASGEGVIAKGHQLRRHPIKWREISTLEATRLLLNDMHGNGQFKEHSEAMAHYHKVGNDAARRQLGPPRVA